MFEDDDETTEPGYLHPPPHRDAVRPPPPGPAEVPLPPVAPPALGHDGCDHCRPTRTLSLTEIRRRLAESVYGPVVP